MDEPAHEISLTAAPASELGLAAEPAHAPSLTEDAAGEPSLTKEPAREPIDEKKQGGHGPACSGCDRGKPERVLAYLSAVLSGDDEVWVESQLMHYALASAAIIFLLIGAAYLFVFRGLANAVLYEPLIFLAVGTGLLAAFAHFHMSSYRGNMSCTNGMMVGMTVGMCVGFLAGALVGATNGMFMGSLAGMTVGIAMGANLGRYCGVMGAMEGIMAGLMAGTMGAMLSVMMVNDHLLEFLFVLFGLCAFVVGGLSYMMYREVGSAKRAAMRASFGQFLAMSAFLALSITALMLYGPKGGIIYP
ncbi:Uncharacterised protein [Candidatus Burarchaeum australiense]|nr:Uncharacterised protein [Candidatus Burarchaeum australiense]